MKKFLAMAMLALLLFNTGGYALLFQYLIYRSDHSINERINTNHYKKADLVEVKIPVHLNIQDWVEYAPISGQVQLRNNNYNYAELKMTRDTMFLMCIPNTEKARLIKANIICARYVDDIPMGKKAHTIVVKKSIDEYNYPRTQYQAAFTAERARNLPRYAVLNIIKPFIGTPCQPPEPGNTHS
ncbi:MAG: hypothetical protein ACXVI9_10415 [Mucilaginibacter sp.]